jgi:hypothetical protein
MRRTPNHIYSGIKGERRGGWKLSSQKSFSRKIMSLPSSKLEHKVIETLLHRINPSAQNNMYQTPQDMIRNHHEILAISHPLGDWNKSVIMSSSCCQTYKSLEITYGCCKGNN